MAIISKLFNLNLIPKHYQVAIVGWLSRLISGVCQLILISVAFSYLGIDLYAVFAVILGLQSWFALTDFGLGSALQNYISEARAKGTSVTHVLSNAAIIIYGLFLIIVIIFLIVSPYLQYFLLRKVSPLLANSHYYIMILCGITFIMINIFGIGYRVFFGMQRGYLVYLYQGFAYILGVLNILIIKYFKISEQHLLIFFLGWFLPNLIFVAVGFVQNFPFKGLWDNFDLVLIKAMLRRGLKFLLLGITTTLAIFSDYVVISQTLSTFNIAIYNILAKSFNFIYFFYSALLSGLWPEVAELFVKKEWHKANVLLNRNILLGCGIIFVCTLLYLAAKNILITFLAPQTSILLPTIPILLFGFYYICRVWVDSYAVSMQSQNIIKITLLVSALQAVLSIGGMYWFSRHFGVVGVLFGLIGALILVPSWILPIMHYKHRA